MLASVFRRLPASTRLPPATAIVPQVRFARPTGRATPASASRSRCCAPTRPGPLATVSAIATLGASGGLAAQSLLCTDPGKLQPNLPAGVEPVEGQGTNNDEFVYQCGQNISNSSLPPLNSPVEDPLPPVDDTITTTAYDTLGNAVVGDSHPSRGQCVIYIDPSSYDPVSKTAFLTFDSQAGNVQPVAGSCLVSLGLVQRTILP